MERKPPSSVGDFVAVIQRRKYWILLPALAVIAAGLALGPLVPRTYKSTSTVLVQGQSVSSVYVKTSENNETSTSRLQQIKLEVMSGKAFPQIIDKLNLYPKLRKQVSMNQLVAAMRKDIEVEDVPDAGDERGGVGAFTISYIGDTPQQTRDATREITNLFLRQSVNDGRQQANGADSFLTAQVAAAAQQLAAEQGKIQAFRSSHEGSLPEEAQADLQMVNQYQQAMQTNQDALTQANQQRVYLQSLLNVKQNGDQGVSAPPPPATPLQLELAEKRQELRADLLKYTPEHPDVIRLKHDIESLKVEIAAAPKGSSAAALTQTPPATGPTMNDQLRSQLVALNSDIKGRQERQLQLEQKAAQLQGSVSGLPAVQTEFAAMNADYAEMQKNYNALLEKQQEAAMTSALNQREQGQPLVVVEPANLPSRPYRPDPVLLRLAAVLMGLLVGLLCGLVVELNDDTMHDSDEVAAYLKLPVMVAVPKCPGVSDRTWKTSIAGS